MSSASSLLRLSRAAAASASSNVSSSSRIAAAASNGALLRSAVLRRNFHPSTSALELSKFAMPAMSPTMTEGGIAAWKKKEGEAFSTGEVLLEIETDKATMDVEAQEDGVVAKIIVNDGAKNVAVNSIIAILAEEGDDLSGADKLAKEAESESPAPAEPKEEKPKEEESKPAPPKEEPKKEEAKKSESSGTAAPQRSEGERIFISPLAKKIALEKGIPLAQIKGTGPNGRIVKADVENYKPSAAAQPAAEQPSAPASKATSAASPSASAASSGAQAAPSSTPYTDVPVSNMRKIIAQRLTESKSTVPHYYVSIDIEMDKVLRLRQVFNDASAKRFKNDPTKAKEAKLSVGDFITKAAVVALDEVPEVRAAWLGDKIRQFEASDISIAVSTPTGLITPIVRDVGHRGLTEISAETKSLAKLARDGKLKSEQYQGGAFTISNMGMFGPTWFSAIINPPQAAILAIGTTRAVILPDESGIEGGKGFRTAQVMSATASFDHRVIDGATGAQWCDAFKRALENPLSFML